MRTQWRTSVNGATGLDYPAVNGVLARMKLGDREDRVFEDIQLMESTIVAEWAREAERARNHRGPRR